MYLLGLFLKPLLSLFLVEFYKTTDNKKKIKVAVKGFVDTQECHTEVLYINRGFRFVLDLLSTSQVNTTTFWMSVFLYENPPHNIMHVVSSLVMD